MYILPHAQNGKIKYTANKTLSETLRKKVWSYKKNSDILTLYFFLQLVLNDPPLLLFRDNCSPWLPCCSFLIYISFLEK